MLRETFLVTAAFGSVGKVWIQILIGASGEGSSCLPRIVTTSPRQASILGPVSSLCYLLGAVNADSLAWSPPDLNWVDSAGLDASGCAGVRIPGLALSFLLSKEQPTKEI